MNHRSAAEAYRNSSIENAPPIKIIRMLYEGMLRFLDQAEREDPTDPGSSFVDLIHRVDRIVVELRSCLNHQVNPDVTQDLERLYLFVEERLSAAALHRSLEPLAEVRPILGVLLEAWNQVEIEVIRAA